jgi:integrase
VRFPVTIRHRQSRVKIYAPGKSFDYYRLSFTVAGKRQMRSFRHYADAKAQAERLVREISQGSQSASLSASQSQDAITALERLNNLHQSTGRKFSLTAAVSEFADNLAKLGGRSLQEAVDGFLRTSAVVKRKDVFEAVEDFVESRKHRSEAKDGKRAQISPVYARNVHTWLTDFAATFPGTAVCDLSKEHLNSYIQKHNEVSTKSRNDRRAAVKMFLAWAVRQDYLPANHRLFEADGMMRETVETAETDYYHPSEFQELLNNASKDVRPVIAIAGLAGLRIGEIMRLDWSEVWRVEGHIEVKPEKSKTRQRRLVEICPALAGALPEANNRQSVSPGDECIPPHLFKTAERFGRPRSQQRLASRVLHVPFRVACERKFDGATGWKLASNHPCALQGTGNEGGGGKMVRTPPETIIPCAFNTHIAV